MTMTITIDTHTAQDTGLDNGPIPRVRRVLASCNLGNPYSVGGMSLSGANLKAILDAQLGTSVPTPTIDLVEALGCSVDGSVEVRWVPATSKIMAFTQGVAASMTPGAQCSLVGGAATVLTHVTDHRVVDPITGIATLSGVAVGPIDITCEAGGVYTQPTILPTGVVPGAGQVAYTQATGTITTRIADGISSIWASYYTVTPGTNCVFTQNTLHVLTTNVLPAEYGAVDLSSALKTVPIAISFHW